MNCGEIWLVDLEDGKGHEQRGTRPAVILGTSTGLGIVVPLTSNLGDARFAHTQILVPTPGNRLDVESVVLVFQIVALDSKRLRHRIGIIDDPDLEAIKALLKDLLNLD